MRKYTTAFLSVLLFLIAADADATHTKKQNYVVPDQTISYFLPSTDPNTVHNHFSQTGGGEIRTTDSYFAHCRVWVQTTISKSFVNDAARINPDNTYYPGDGFWYLFSYGWDGGDGCRNFRVCPVQSNLIGSGTTRCDVAVLEPLPKPTPAFSGSVAGMGEISTTDASGHFVQLVVTAERYSCFYPKKAKAACGWSTITSAGVYRPAVIRPTLDLVITQEYLRDYDGFVSGNLDGTYYLWDAINLVHTPTYPWKQERLGTISITITKQYDLKLEQEFQCTSKTCQHTLHRPGFEPWMRDYEYGSGTTLMNATLASETKKHHIWYKAELLNLGRPILRQEAKQDVLVVRYDPMYVSYPYLVLKDGHAFSWGNRPAVALYYLGSHGGGDDDTFGIHEKRRSKINSYNYSGHAFDPILQKPLNEVLSWSGSSAFVSKSSCTDMDLRTDSLEAGKKNSAMFVKKGFGKLVFSYPILHTMLGKRYLNATIDNTLQSSGFAGSQTRDLVHYTYQYPDIKFANPVKILTYHSDGSRTNLAVSVQMVPDTKKGAQYTHDYVCSKVKRDTGLEEFAEMVVGDMYDRENHQNGTGYTNLKSKLTSTWFPELYYVLSKDIMGLDLNAGYGAPSPYEITITVGQKKRTLNKIVNFLSPFTHVANLDEDNLLGVTTKSGLLRIHPNEKFGEIVKIQVNGEMLERDCTNGCTLHHKGALKIEAWNVWGGRAVAVIESPEEIRFTRSYDWNLVAVALFVAAVGWLLSRLAKKALVHFASFGNQD